MHADAGWAVRWWVSDGTKGEASGLPSRQACLRYLGTKRIAIAPQHLTRWVIQRPAKKAIDAEDIYDG